VSSRAFEITFEIVPNWESKGRQEEAGGQSDTAPPSAKLGAALYRSNDFSCASICV